MYASSPFADWLLWSRPALAGRIAFDARFELLSAAQLQRAARFQARVGNWLMTARGYRVFVLDPRSDHAVERSLLVKRIVAGLVITAALVFAVQGGEFGTLDLMRQRRTKAKLF